MVDELFQKMCVRVAEQIEQAVMSRVERSLARFCRDRIKVVYSETEAADFLGVKRATLSAWRKRGLIEYAHYPIGRTDGGADRLGDVHTYDVAALLSFRQRYLVKTTAASSFEIKEEISLLGPEIAKVTLRKAA